MRRLLAAALLASLAIPVFAAAPIKITSDTFTVDDAAHQATFSGNVVVDREAMRLTAGTVLVEYGEGGVSDITAFTATGGVHITTKDQSASGDKAVYVPTTQVLTITGNVTVESPMGKLNGPQLVIDLKNNTSVFSGGKKGRVTGVFTPQ
jgi:lipopolysaccharide export system protein LptA